jgi:hypothetical protein
MKRFADFGTSFWPQLARFDLARPLGRTVTLIRAKPEGRRPNGPERTGNMTMMRSGRRARNLTLYRELIRQ